MEKAKWVRKSLSLTAAVAVAVVGLATPASAAESMTAVASIGLRTDVDYATTPQVLVDNTVTTLNANAVSGFQVVDVPSGSTLTAAMFELANGDLRFESTYLATANPYTGGFDKAGDYVFKMTTGLSDVSATVTVTVGGAVASIVATPAINPAPAAVNLPWTVVLKDDAGRVTSLDPAGADDILGGANIGDDENLKLSQGPTSITTFDYSKGSYSLTLAAPAAGTNSITAAWDNDNYADAAEVTSAAVSLVTKGLATNAAGNTKVVKADGVVSTGDDAAAQRVGTGSATFKYDGDATNDKDKFIKFDIAMQGGLNATGDVTGTNNGVWVLTDANGDATFTVNVVTANAAAGETYNVVVTGSAATTEVVTFRAAGHGAAVTVKSPVNLTRSVTKGSTQAITYSVKDIFEVAVANATINVGNYTAANFSPFIPSQLTNAAGEATFTFVDTAATVRNEVVYVGLNGAAATSANNVTLKYIADATPATLSVVVAKANAFAAAAAAAATDAEIAAANVTIDNAETANTDDVKYEILVKNAAGDSLKGVDITVAAAQGAYLGTAQGTTVANAKASLALVSAATAANAFSFATKAGLNTITFTAGGLTKAITVKYSNATADARNIEAVEAAYDVASGDYKTVSFKVTDRFGNAVSGATVAITEVGVGRLANGTSSTGDLKTNADGIVSADVVAGALEAGAQVVTAKLSGGQSDTTATGAANSPVTGTPAAVNTASATVNHSTAAAPVVSADATGLVKKFSVVVENAKGKVVKVFVGTKRVGMFVAGSDYVVKTYKAAAGTRVVSVKVAAADYSRAETIKVLKK